MGEKNTKILKQAYWLVRGQKSLWLAGLFLVWPNLFLGSFLLYVFANAVVPAAGEGSITYAQPRAVEGDPIIGAISIAVIIILAILYFRFRAYVTLLVQQALASKNLDVKKIWLNTRHRALSLLSLSMSFFSGLVVFFTLVSVPIANLAGRGQDDRAIGLGIIAAALFIPVLVVVYMAMVTSPLFLVAYGLGLWDSVRVCLDIIRRVWRRLLVFTGYMTAIHLIGLVLSVAISAIISAPFVLLSRVFYDVESAGSLTMTQGLALIVGFMVFFMSQAAVSVYSRTAWSVLFFQIVKPVKVEKASETAAVPESVPTE